MKCYYYSHLTRGGFEAEVVKQLAYSQQGKRALGSPAPDPLCLCASSMEQRDLGPREWPPGAPAPTPILEQAPVTQNLRLSCPSSQKLVSKACVDLCPEFILPRVSCTYREFSSRSEWRLKAALLGVWMVHLCNNPF